MMKFLVEKVLFPITFSLSIIALVVIILAPLITIYEWQYLPTKCVGGYLMRQRFNHPDQLVYVTENHQPIFCEVK